MAKKKVRVADASKIADIAREIVEVPIDRFLEAEYLPYAYYVILNRALVPADGMKPVHKRIIYEMYRSGLYGNKPHLKASTIAGNVMGNFHPHGDGSISDALARLGQDFSLRVPLIDPSGSVGYFTGDPAAAPRYWEAKLTPAAVELVKEVDYKALPMGRNFSDTLDEPSVLPARWPAVLINGTEGIAVGYASNIPPHNPTEVMKATIAYVKNPEITVKNLMKIMPGPDFPTGGEVLQAEALESCYETGRGSIVLQSKYTVEPLSRGRHRITLTELPYQVAARQIIKEIREKKNPPSKKGSKEKAKKAELTYISSEKNLTDTEHGTRVEIILKSGTNVNIALQDIFRLTSAQKVVSYHQTIISEGAPVLVSLKEILEDFVTLRKKCIINYSQEKLNKNEAILSRLSGLVTILADIDKVIEIIKDSETDEDAIESLISEFSINEEQAKYVLELKLKSLKNKDVLKLKADIASVEEECKGLRVILSDESALNEELIAQLEATKKIIGDKRRTTINNKTIDELKEESKVARQAAKVQDKNLPVLITLFADGTLIKTTDSSEASKSSKSPLVQQFKVGANDEIFAVYPDGRGVKVPPGYIPLDSLLTADKVGLSPGFIGLGKASPDEDDLGLLTVTKLGKVSGVSSPSVSKDTFEVVTPEEGDELIFATWVEKERADLSLLAVSSESLALRFPISSVRIANYGVTPIKGMTISDGECIVGASIVQEDDIVVTTSTSTLKVSEVREIKEKGRGGKGMILHPVQKDDKLTMAYAGSDLVVIDLLGESIALPEPTARATRGTKMNTVDMSFGIRG